MVLYVVNLGDFEFKQAAGNVNAAGPIKRENICKGFHLSIRWPRRGLVIEMSQDIN